MNMVILMIRQRMSQERNAMTKKDIWICPVCGFKMFKVVGGVPNCPKCGYKTRKERE